MKSPTLIVAFGVALAAGGLAAGTGLAQGMGGMSHGSMAHPGMTHNGMAGGKMLHERQALMQQQAHDLGAVHAYLAGEAPQARAATAAADLTNTTRRIPDVFAQGSGGTSPDGKFATKPEIWSDWQGFLAAQNNAVRKAFALETAVKTGDKGRIAVAFADLGKNGCGACHGKFREKK